MGSARRSWLLVTTLDPKTLLDRPSLSTVAQSHNPQAVADKQKQWKDIRAKYTEAVEE
jgi:hypothetical protein